MSDTEKKLVLPVDLPKCDCFDTGDPECAMTACVNVARACNTMVTAFYELAEMEGLCKKALPYFAEMFMVSLLSALAKTDGPALQYGSQEIEWEVERMLAGMEARILARSRDVYAHSRELGMTEESVRAMREGDKETQQ